MRNSKLGLKALGLCILGSLSLMAFFAAGAQAQELLSPPKASELVNAGKFFIGLNLGAALLATLEGEQKNPGTLEVVEKKLRITCASGKVTGGKINTATDASATSVLFTGCVVLDLENKQIADCTVLSGAEPTGSIVTNAVLALPVLHYKKAQEGTPKLFVAFEPQVAGGNFALVKIHGKVGESECPLPLENPVKGYVAAEVVGNHTTTTEPELIFSAAISELVGHKRLLFGVATATLAGSVKGKLAGAPHAGLVFGVV